MHNLHLAGDNSPCKITSQLKFNPVFCLLLLAAMLLSAITFKARAKDFFPTQTDFGVRLGLDYELPGKNLKDAYKAGLNYNAGFLFFKDDFTVSANLSYRQFAAKYPQIIDNSDPVNPASSTTSPYSTFLFYLSGTYQIRVASVVKLYGGINMGVGISSYEVSYKDFYSDINIGGSQKQGYFAPTLGAKFALNNNWDIDVHANYNIYTTGGDYTYNSRTGEIGQSINISTAMAAGVGLIFKF